MQVGLSCSISLATLPQCLQSHTAQVQLILRTHKLLSLYLQVNLNFVFRCHLCATEYAYLQDRCSPAI